MPDPSPAADLTAGWGVLAVLCLLIAASVWLGTVAQRVVRRGTFMKGYFLGNRGLGSWTLALTATVQSGGTFIGFPSFVYSFGWVVALWIGAYMVVPLTGFGFIGKRFAQLSRRTGALTVPDLFRARFGSPAVGLTSSLLILFFMTFMMVAQFKGGAVVLKVALPWSEGLALTEDADAIDRDYYYGLAVFTLTVVGYTLIGGFLAAVWTDLFQSVMMFVGVMLLLPLTLLAVGGIGAATERLRYEAPPAEVKAEERAARAPRRVPAEERLTRLDAALRRYAALNKGRLPERLADLDEPDLATDPVTGQPLIYYGAHQSLTGPGAPQRTLLAITPPDDPDEKKAWKSALYSNGAVRSGRLGEPGSLCFGPGPGDWLPLGAAFSFFFMWVYAGLGSPAGTVRIMACKDTVTIRRSIVLLGTYNLCIYVPLVLICICGRAILPDLPANQSDEIIPRLAVMSTREFFGGSFVSGVILTAPFGAVMATVSSYLVVIASGVVRDIYQRFINPDATPRELRRLSYVAMVVVGAIGVAANISPVTYLQSLVVFSGTCGATAFVVPYLMAAYWRRATAAGAMAAMLTGLVTMVSLYAYGSWQAGKFQEFRLLDLHPIVWGLTVSLLAGVLVSLVTRPPEAALVSRLFDEETQPADAAV